MSSDVSEPPTSSLYQLRLVAILSRAFYFYMESQQPYRRTRAGKRLLKSAAQRSRDQAVVMFAYELLVEDMLLSNHPDMVAAWMLDVGLSHGLLQWSEGDLMVIRMPSIGDCQGIVRARWQETQASGHPVIHTRLAL